MNQDSIIADIERKARRAGVSIRFVCSRASVHPTTFSRWKRSDRNPEPLGATLHSVRRLYDALDQIAAEQAPRSRKRAGGRA